MKRWGLTIVSILFYFYTLTSIVILSNTNLIVPRIVEVRLVTVVSEDGKHAWEFLIDNKEISAGTKVNVFKDFPISIKDFYSRKIIDKVNIGSLIRQGDVITYRYFSARDGENEKIFIEIQHKDNTFTWVSLNI